MNRAMLASALLATSAFAAAPPVPQPQRLSLQEAEEIALRSHPALEAGKLEALAIHQRVHEVKAATHPFATANLTAVSAPDNTRIAAGGLNNPAIYSRVASGVTVNQLLFDFGRTTHLVESSKASAAAGDQRAEAARADVILAVRRAYFAALRAENIIRVAKATVDARQIVVDQVSELVKAKLKSGLDLSFAETNLSEAKLLAAGADNDRQAAFADLARALGRQAFEVYELTDVPDPNVEPLALSEFRAQALRNRPELKAARLEVESARDAALAERSARLPAVAATVGAGYVPSGVTQLPTGYIAGGLNISLPFMNGGLMKARQTEAELRSRAVAQRLADLENGMTRDVTRAWLDVNTAFQRIQLTRRFVDQAAQALDLAQTRYELGLSSIVELSQAQLTKTNAEIQFAAAKYDYQLLRSLLDYSAGRL